MKKGFTLLELLAVIVILAIVSIIAIPVILNVVEKSRKSSAINSAYGYINAIEDGIVIKEIKSGIKPDDKEYIALRSFERTYDIKVKGTTPTAGKFTLEKRKVVSAEFIIDGYIIRCSNSVCHSTGKSELIMISYDLDGGIADKEVDAIEKGKTVELPTPTKTGYTFSGWYDEDSHAVTNETTFNKDTTVYARYTVNKYTITLKNAKFSDNSTSKSINYGEEVQISAVIPSGYTDSNYIGQTSCSSDSDIGNIKYRINHGYTVESWNVTDSLENQITYKVPAKNETVTATIKEAELITDRQECYSYDASYSSGYYYCPNGGSRSGSTCTTTTTSTYSATCEKQERHSRSCPQGGSHSGCTPGYYYICVEYSCSSGDSLSGATCTHSETETYSASWSSGYYYCSGGGSRSGTTCYKTRSIN